ncbi:MAG: hypothetical protein ABEJ35_04405 [Halobacteriaceae archaeon]
MGARRDSELPPFRFTNDLSRLVGALIGIVVVLALAVGLRLVLVEVLDDAVHPVTYVALIGGTIGAIAMAVVMQVQGARRNLPSTDLLHSFAPELFEESVSYLYAGMALHVVYGAVTASFYPRLMRGVLDVRGGQFVAFPNALLWTVLFSAGLALLGTAYAALGWIDLDVGLWSRAYHRFLLLHLVFAVSLAVMLGIYWPFR